MTSPLLSSEGAFETFPTFSPDGNTLYFCSAKARTMPKEYDQVRYDLCSVSFDPATRRFGTVVDTLYKASEIDKSVSFPRVSPDGKYLLYTLSGYGNFSIWHKDADLYMIDLSTLQSYPLEAANSDDVESYHSWSSDSRWIVLAAVGWMVCIQGRSSLILMGKDRLANLSCYLRRIRIFIFVL